MENLKQLISDAEKYSRIRTVLEQHLHNKVYKNYMELAERLDISGNSLYQVMKGNRTPPDILAYKFCELFNYEPGYFFGRSPVLKALKQANYEISRDDLLEIQRQATALNQTIADALAREETPA